MGVGGGRWEDGGGVGVVYYVALGGLFVLWLFLLVIFCVFFYVLFCGLLLFVCGFVLRVLFGFLVVCVSCVFFSLWVLCVVFVCVCCVCVLFLSTFKASTLFADRAAKKWPRGAV